MQRLSKTLITGVLVMLMAVDPAAASRWFRGGCCRPAPCYRSMPAYCSPQPSCCYETVVDYGACGQGGHGQGSVEYSPEPVPMNESLRPEPPAPPLEDTGRPELPPDTGSASPSDTVPTPPVRSIPKQPMTDTLPGDTVTPDTTVTPDSTLPDVSSPDTSLPDLSTPDTTTPPDAPAIPDLLDGDSPMPPADSSTTPGPDAIPDLFNDSSTPAAPDTPELMPEETSTPDTKPAADAVDDLFKDSSSLDPPAADALAVPASAETPAAADDLGSLFDAPTADAPAADSPALDAPADAASDAEPMKTAADPALEAIDLLSEPDAPAASEPASSDMTDAREPMRLWTDNTGKYQVRARLLVILDGKVRLLKETGRTTTVPFNRLSKGDLAFVHHQAELMAMTQVNAGH